MADDFKNRVIIITGAGSGLGKEYAHWFAAHGAKVVANSLSHPGQPEGAANVVQHIRAAGGDAVADSHDVSAEGSGSAIVQTALNAFGRVDAVIANAGLGEQGHVTAINVENMRRSMAINFWGAVAPVLAALPHMLAQGYGRIVLTSSAAGLFGQENHIAYAAAKTALIGFNRVLAIDAAKDNIRVNILSPYSRTDMSKHMLPDTFNQIMPPSKIAPVAGWLASESCSISGQIIASGAGRLRRDVIIEGPVVAIQDDDVAAAWAIAEKMATKDEYQSAVGSAMDMIPELKALFPAGT